MEMNGSSYGCYNTETDSCVDLGAFLASEALEVFLASELHSLFK